jgi:hypothetical protein
MLMMEESGFRYVSQAPSVLRVALNVLVGIVGGLLAAATAVVAMNLLILVLSLPAFSVLALGILGIGLGFLVGGAVARHLAGPRPARGWMGALFALAFAVALYLLPQHGWAYLPQHDWVSAVSLEDLVVQGRPDLARDYALPIRVTTPLVGVVLGCLGDICLVRRRRPKVS